MKIILLLELLGVCAMGFNLSEFSNHYYGNLLIPRNSSFECPIRQGAVIWDEYSVSNPSIIRKDGKFFLFFVAKDKTYKDSAGTSRIALTWSKNISDFYNKAGLPVLFPAIDNNIKCT